MPDVTPNQPERAQQTAGLHPELLNSIVQVALTEDLGGHPGRDVTTFATIPDTQERTIEVVARADGVIAGLQVLGATMTAVATRFRMPLPLIEMKSGDGAHVKKGDVLARITGRTHVLLVAERTALNLLCRMSGVATHTAKWAEALKGTGATVLDTRKTTPGLRACEKYAVRCGGGTNKRMGLYDVAMIKDNHKLAAGSITKAYENVRTTFPEVPIQVEVTTPEEAVEAVKAGARFLLCDNMSPDVLRDAVIKARAATEEKVEIEATGGLTLDKARAYGETGVDFMSVGGLTHSSPILDVAMDLVAESVRGDDAVVGPAATDPATTAVSAVVADKAPSGTHAAGTSDSAPSQDESEVSTTTAIPSDAPAKTGELLAAGSDDGTGADEKATQGDKSVTEAVPTHTSANADASSGSAAGAADEGVAKTADSGGGDEQQARSNEGTEAAEKTSELGTEEIETVANQS